MRAVALLWAGQATSAVGDQMFLVALAWVAVEVLGDRAGYLTLLLPAVTLLVALLAGGAADRHPPRRLMVASDLFRAGVLGLLVVLWTVRGTPPAWALVAAIAALAAGQALFRPALQALLPPLVDDARALPGANALMETTERIARLVGPASIGLLAGVVPLVHFVTLDVASFVLSAAAIAATVALRPLAAHAPPFGGGMARGFRAMRTHPVLHFILYSLAPLNAIWWVSMFLAVPLLIGPRAAGGLGQLGLVWACYGATNLATNLLMGGAAPRHPGRLVFAADVILGCGIVVIGASALLLPPGWAVAGYCAGAALGAVGGPLSDVTVAVLRQTRLARSDQAAAMRAVLVMWNAGTLAGMAAAPTLFSTFGVAETVLGGGVVMAAAGLAGLVTHHATPH